MMIDELVLILLRPRVHRAEGNSVFFATTEQWKRGVNADEWIEYEPEPVVTRYHGMSFDYKGRIYWDACV